MSYNRTVFQLGGGGGGGGAGGLLGLCIQSFNRLFPVAKLIAVLQNRFSSSFISFFCTFTMQHIVSLCGQLDAVLSCTVWKTFPWLVCLCGCFPRVFLA